MENTKAEQWFHGHNPNGYVFNCLDCGAKSVYMVQNIENEELRFFFCESCYAEELASRPALFKSLEESMAKYSKKRMD